MATKVSGPGHRGVILAQTVEQHGASVPNHCRRPGGEKWPPSSAHGARHGRSGGMASGWRLRANERCARRTEDHSRPPPCGCGWVVDGRLWRQIGDVRRASRTPYLLIEGPDLDDGPLTPAAVRGVCLTIIGHGVPILWALDGEQSAVWLDRLASRASAPQARDRPVYAQIRKPRGDRVPEAMLAAIPGTSTKRAAALLAAFGSVSAVGTARIDELLRVRGIGPTEAQRVREAFT
jgi:Helix-hairpin-helix domain